MNAYGLTSLGSGHTAFSLVAVAVGLYLLIRYREITVQKLAGKVYVVATLVSVLSGFGIFQHGGFGKPHALGVITLIAMAVALLAAYTQLFGRASRYVEVVSYSTTFLFHLIPGVTETTTRLPFGKPVFASPEAEELQLIAAGFLVAFLVGAALQVLRLRAASRSGP